MNSFLPISAPNSLEFCCHSIQAKCWPDSVFQADNINPRRGGSILLTD